MLLLHILAATVFAAIESQKIGTWLMTNLSPDPTSTASVENQPVVSSPPEHILYNSIDSGTNGEFEKRARL